MSYQNRGGGIRGGDLRSDDEKLEHDRNRCLAIEEIHGYPVSERERGIGDKE